MLQILCRIMVHATITALEISMVLLLRYEIYCIFFSMALN
jgi:hypothetical protein